MGEKGGGTFVLRMTKTLLGGRVAQVSLEPEEAFAPAVGFQAGFPADELQDH